MGQCVGYGGVCNPIGSSYGYHIPYHHVTQTEEGVG